MSRKDLVGEWLASGLRDLDSAKFPMAMRPKPLEIIGFHCQQAVEKHLKAFLVSNALVPDKTHDLLFLLRECSAFDSDFQNLAPACAMLTEYAVRTRYPHPGTVDEPMIGAAIDHASGATDYVRRLLDGKDSA